MLSKFSMLTVSKLWTLDICVSQLSCKRQHLGFFTHSNGYHTVQKANIVLYICLCEFTVHVHAADMFSEGFYFDKFDLGICFNSRLSTGFLSMKAEVNVVTVDTITSLSFVK